MHSFRSLALAASMVMIGMRQGAVAETLSNPKHGDPSVSAPMFEHRSRGRGVSWRDSAHKREVKALREMPRNLTPTQTNRARCVRQGRMTPAKFVDLAKLDVKRAADRRELMRRIVDT